MLYLRKVEFQRFKLIIQENHKTKLLNYISFCIGVKYKENDLFKYTCIFFPSQLVVQAENAFSYI